VLLLGNNTERIFLDRGCGNNFLDKMLAENSERKDIIYFTVFSWVTPRKVDLLLPGSNVGF
jgi:hypothetical protein